VNASQLARVIRAVRVDRNTGTVPHNRPLKTEVQARTGLSDKD
jgi:hypothetical protein